MKNSRPIFIKNIRWSCESYTGELLSMSSKELLFSYDDNINFEETTKNIKLYTSKDNTLNIKGTAKAIKEKNRITFSISPSTFDKISHFLGTTRKIDHISLCETSSIEAKDKFTGFSKLSFLAEAAPELNWNEIKTEQIFLKHTFNYPIMIPGMTGGVQKGRLINERLAKAASYYKIPMGVGSQRIALENENLKEVFLLRSQFPQIFLVANIGIGELLHSDAPRKAQKAVDMIEAQALAIHLNVAQECVQAEGSRNFKGFYKSLEEICNKSKVPILVKEVGCGMLPQTAYKLIQAGASALDIGGKGGTSWPYIESLRSNHESWLNLGESMRDWGIPTAYSLALIRKKLPQTELVATGGIRNGLTIAKACALGAQMAGIALPFMQAALKSEEAVFQLMDSLIHGLKTTMMTTASSNLKELSSKLCLGQALEREFYNLFKENEAHSLEKQGMKKPKEACTETHDEK